ncbi:hypothetical protein KP509_36G038100 [Ceratopteris richardii]|nr:hypothetical protein KP509_36G038100 [Ceratopteris richardii]
MTLAKCGAVDDARVLSASLPYLTVFSWTAILFAYADSGRGEEALEAYQCMQKNGIEPDSFTFVSLFKACSSIQDRDKGKELHAHAHSMGMATNKFVGNTIISMYGKCGALSDAEEVFVALTDRDTVSWNGMLSAYVEQSKGDKCLLLYRQMNEEGVHADLATFIIVLQACIILVENSPKLSKEAVHEIGRGLHAKTCRKGFISNLLVGTAALSMYAHCGTTAEAEHTFNVLSNPDTAAWNAMLSLYVAQEQAEKALLLYMHMLKQDISSDHLTYILAVQACGILAESAVQYSSMKLSISKCLEIGKALHSDICVKGYMVLTPIANTLLCMYGKCRAIAEAEEVFQGIIDCDTISWNAMLSAYCEQKEEERALSLFKVMQDQKVSPSDVTLLCILQACGETGDLELCRNVNFIIVFAGFDKFPSLTASLVNAYGGCASELEAHAVFSSFAEPSIVLWNACISGHAAGNSALGSLHVFESMMLAGIMPDSVTYSSLLPACSRNGLVECLEYLGASGDGVTEEKKLSNIIIDLFGRAGDFERLKCYFEKIKAHADHISWFSLLGACSAHGNLELAKHLFKDVVQVELEDGPVYVVMSNVYAAATY